MNHRHRAAHIIPVTEAIAKSTYLGLDNQKDIVYTG